MKNLYLFIVFLFFAKSFSQQDLQNANWVFGDNLWLNFDNTGVQNQTVLPPNSIDSQEGVASVSDLDGNLLFWTDGTRVYWLNGATVNVYNSPALLFGNGSSFQNVVITPRPNHPGRYYIFYISGYTSTQANQVTGLYRAEVDTVNHVVLNPNTPLLDAFGTPINNAYGNLCEALTTAPATNGDYWLITHVQNLTRSFIYSYRIAENTIQNEFQLNFVNNIDNPSLAIKISSNLDRIALTRDGVNPVLGNFDPANGFITNLNLIGQVPPTGIYNYCNGLEFSPTGNNLFFKRAFDLMVVSVANPTVEFTINNDILSAGAIQRAIDGNLYVARKGDNFLSVINNPDFPVLNQATITHDLDFDSDFPIEERCITGLPQWVWQNCNQTLTSAITIPIILHEERSDWISSRDVITFGNASTNDGVIYHAGNFIDLLPGFESRTTSNFAAYIQGCTEPQSYVYKQSSSNNDSDSTSLVNDLGAVRIYPNPSSSSIEIQTSNIQFNKVQIISIDGKLVFNNTFETTDKVMIDISDYKEGVYIVNITSENGQSLSGKLVKN